MTAPVRSRSLEENARLFGKNAALPGQLAFLNNIRALPFRATTLGTCWAIVGKSKMTAALSTSVTSACWITAPKNSKLQAEAGANRACHGRRFHWVSNSGRVSARTGERPCVQNGLGAMMARHSAGSRSVLCIPITYGDKLCWARSISKAATKAHVLPRRCSHLNNLRGSVATALHNAFVFQEN